jgi:putative flippase GtrA
MFLSNFAANWSPARRRSARLFLAYISIGGFVFCVDAGLFQFLVWQHVVLALAATAAYAVGVATHFTLNRFLNFRAFERAIHNQARTYSIIVFFQCLITLAVIEAVVALGFLPFIAKVVAVAVNIPIGFMAHRYITFGGGLRVVFARLRRGSK